MKLLINKDTDIHPHLGCLQCFSGWYSSISLGICHMKNMSKPKCRLLTLPLMRVHTLRSCEREREQCMHALIYACIRTHTHTHTHTVTHTWCSRFRCISIRNSICTTYADVHTHTHTHTYMHACTYTHTHTYIHTCIHTSCWCSRFRCISVCNAFRVSRDASS